MFAVPAGLGLSARNAGPADRPFLRRLYAVARPDAALLAHWPEKEREGFLDMQFRLQDAAYGGAYPGADHLILLRQGAPVGRLILDRTMPDWQLVDIALLPEERGRGLGTQLLSAMLDAARAAGAASLGLHVELNNPARQLYERMGFVEIESDSGMHAAMIWRSS